MNHDSCAAARLRDPRAGTPFWAETATRSPPSDKVVGQRQQTPGRNILRHPQARQYTAPLARPRAVFQRSTSPPYQQTAPGPGRGRATCPRPARALRAPSQDTVPWTAGLTGRPSTSSEKKSASQWPPPPGSSESIVTAQRPARLRPLCGAAADGTAGPCRAKAPAAASAARSEDIRVVRVAGPP